MLDVSVVIATHNMRHLLYQTIENCLKQDYANMEIVVYDDASTDNTEDLFCLPPYLYIKYFRGEKNVGVGQAFNEAIKRATGDIIILMCADDLFTDSHVISDIVAIFKDDKTVGYVSRWYYQFVDGDPRPVRSWRSMDPVIQANNPSGLAFRREALKGRQLSNHMFIESSALASQVIRSGWNHRIMCWDTVAVRVHKSTSTQPGYWLKRRVSSPVMDWYELGAKDIAKDYVSFIQIKNGFRTSAVWEEICNFVKLRPRNVVNPGFWFFAVLALVTPRTILRRIPDLYRRTWGRFTTKAIKRPCDTASV